MARTTTKKRAKQLKHDKFRDTTMGAVDRLAHRFEGRGRTLLYLIGGALALLLLFYAFSWWRDSRADRARLALGHAIKISSATVTASPQPGSTDPTFPSERERATRAVEEFQKVQREYGSPYKEMARYFAATHLLVLDRAKGLSELEEMSKAGGEVAPRAKFALAQARESDGQFDPAAALYQELLNDQNRTVSENTLKLRLAAVYEKQGKKDAAVDILYGMVEAARKAAQGKDAKPAPDSPAVAAAETKLQELSPERYAQLTPEPAAPKLPPL